MLKKTSSSIIVALLFCAVILSAVPTYAADEISSAASAGFKAIDGKHYLEEAVLKLMEEGKLSKDKVEKILQYKKKRLEEQSKQDKMSKEQLKNQRKKGSLLRDLIHDGILTEAEGEAIKTKLKEMKEARLQGGLQQLVDKGVLSDQDISNIRSYMLKIREERSVQMEKLRSMTAQERKAYFESEKKNRKDILERMVEDKILTLTQVEEIRKVVPELDRERYKKAQ